MIIARYCRDALRCQSCADAFPAAVARIIYQKSTVASSYVQPLAVKVHGVLIHLELPCVAIICEADPFARRQQRVYSAAVRAYVQSAVSFRERSHPVVRQARV